MESSAEASSDRVRAALALPARAGLYQALVESEHGLSSDELARKAGLHPNTVRWHLRRLEEAGLVSSEREQGRRGRPRLRFRARPVADEAAEFRLLAGALTKALSALPDGAGRAELAGFELGRSLMREPADADEAVTRVHALLERQGFQPERAGTAIVMHRCPFLDLVLAGRKDAAVVCGLHRGIVAGGLTGMGSPLELETFKPFATPTTCVVGLVRAKPG
jgi:predicted ArsR family transcriptional regulator